MTSTGAKIWSVINCISSSGHMRLNPLVSQSYFKTLQNKKQTKKFTLIQNVILVSVGSFRSLQRSEVNFLLTGFDLELGMQTQTAVG